MADGDREYIGGWLVVENRELPWDCAIMDRDVRIIVCGEIGHVRWTLFQAAWREAVYRDLELALRAFADRVGIEYRPALRRPWAPHNATQRDSNGGNP